jgi:hypothetical protein
MSFHLKRKIAFALIMALLTTGIISFTVIGVNLGFIDHFLQIWVKSWLIAYLIAVPCILIAGPMIEKLVQQLVKEKIKANH